MNEKRVATDPQAQPPADSSPAPDPWIDAEFDQAVDPRRKEAGLTDTNAERWGLALSGGGIRSATFCLGLVRGLAKNHTLKRFDYLSTVSGGGYVGASLCRLFGHGVSAEQIERGVESDRSLWLWWLRSNGRYLTPTGLKDMGQAAVSIVRGALATQLELGILLILLSCAVVLPHAVIASIPEIGRNANSQSLPISVWFFLLPLPVFMGAYRLFAYWLTRASPVRGGIPMMLAYAVLCAALTVVAADWSNSVVSTIEDIQQQISELSWSLRIAVATLLAAGAWAFSFGIRDVFRIRADAGEFVLRERRLRHTRALLFWTIVTLGVCAIALVDWFSWRLATIANSESKTGIVYGGAGLAALGLVACRAVQPVLQAWMDKHPGHHINLERVLGVLVYGLLIAIAIGWTTLVHDMVLPDILWRANDEGEHASSLYPLVIWSLLFLFSLLFVVLTGRNFDTVNMASLHGYYRARIERAYISSGNVGTQDERFDRHPITPIDLYTANVRPPDTVVRGDDVPMSEYAPQTHGGPIHLINCCINQTVDDGSRYFNGDRKGVALTLSSTGTIEIGTSSPQAPIADLGFLSKWIAISGAAAGSGMGSQTSPTYSALLFLSGMRLGIWQQRLSRGHRGNIAQDPSPKQWGTRGRLPLKVQAIASELFGQFPGLDNDTWYVSDGGHFDNTGVYPLIKREMPLIVVADCGADPKYLFEDIESMVRKARIDFGADIDFIDPKDIVQGSASDLVRYLGTPETIGPEADSACLLLGRIRYRSGDTGTLLVVKPRRLEHMPFDVVAYADRHATYPQETTSDQFFDESQWESYQNLGAMIGGLLTPALIAQAQEVVAAGTLARSSLSEALKTRKKFTARIDRLRPVVTASAAGAGIGLSLVLALWQGGSKALELWRGQVEQKVATGKRLSDAIASGRLDAVDASAIIKLRGFSLKERESFEQAMLALSHCDEAQAARCEELKRSIEQIITFNSRDYWTTFYALQKKAPAQEDQIVVAAEAPVSASPAVGATTATTASATTGAVAGRTVTSLPQPTPQPTPTPSTIVDVTGVSPPEPALTSLPPKNPVSTTAPKDPSQVSGIKIIPISASTPVSGDRKRLDSAAVAAAAATRVEALQQRELQQRALAIEAQRPTAARLSLAKQPSTVCDQAAIYVHIYDEASRPGAQCLVNQIEALLGQRPQGVENVVATALRRDKDMPTKFWGVPAVLSGEAHRERLAACSAQLTTLLGGKAMARTLPSRMRSRSSMIEVWLPTDWRGDPWLLKRCQTPATNQRGTRR